MVLVSPIIYAVDGDVSRNVPKTTPVTLPPYDPDKPCPPILDGHISICGIVETATMNTVTDKVRKVDYDKAHQPIEGATVAVYLGAGFLGFEDINKTGELVGKVEGLYMYNTTTVHGKYILAAPRGAGTDGMAYLAFFCGDYLKDLYMIDTSQDIHVLPVSISCGAKVTPSSQNAIPAPPSVDYVIRETPTSCFPKFDPGNPGINRQYLDGSVTINLKKEQHDNTYTGAIVEEEWNNGVLVNVNFVDTPSTAAKYSGNSTMIPIEDKVLNRADIEGFVHSSMAYSLQAISSLNCGISGCYDVKAPTYFSPGESAIGAGLSTLDKTDVLLCNTATYPIPQQCIGPGIGLATPGSWEESYKLQKNVQIYSDTKVGQIASPGNSIESQKLHNIYEAIKEELDLLRQDQEKSEHVTLVLNIFGIQNENDILNSGASPEEFLEKIERTWNQFTAINSSVSNISGYIASIGNPLEPIQDFKDNINGITVSDLTDAAKYNVMYTLQATHDGMPENNSAQKIVKGAYQAVIDLMGGVPPKPTLITTLETFARDSIDTVLTAKESFEDAKDDFTVLHDSVLAVFDEYQIGLIEIELPTGASRVVAAIQDLVIRIESIVTQVDTLSSSFTDYKTAVDTFFSSLSQVFTNIKTSIDSLTLPTSLDDPTNLAGEFESIKNTALSSITTTVNDITTATNTFTNTTAGAIQTIIDDIKGVVNIIRDNYAMIKDEIISFYETVARLYFKLMAVIAQNAQVDTVNEFFPYSALLNYEFGKPQTNNFQNVPETDSYMNESGADQCPSVEEQRQSPSAFHDYIAEYPFKTCYWANFPAEDTYSAQKALHTATKNLREDNIPVANFYAPGEPVGEERDPLTNVVELNEIVQLQKVGKGYWRIGIMNTLCTRGALNTADVWEYPSVAITGGNEIKWN